MSHDASVDQARHDARRARVLEVFYFAHVAPLVAAVFLLDFETFP